MLSPQLFLTVWLITGCLCYHVEETSHTCEEDEYFSEEDQMCHPCQEFTCGAGFEPNLSCGGGRSLTGLACIKCQDGYFSRPGENCQRCSVCWNTLYDTPCTPESDIICGPCKKGYVMLGYHCRSCDHVPYPSHYEPCKERETQPRNVKHIPLEDTNTGSSEKTATSNHGKEQDQQGNLLLVIVIIAGLILLVALVVILGIVTFWNYKRHGICCCSGDSRPGTEGSDEQEEARQDNQNRVANIDGGDETDGLTSVVLDSQQVLRQDNQSQVANMDGGDEADDLTSVVSDSQKVSREAESTAAFDVTDTNGGLNLHGYDKPQIAESSSLVGNGHSHLESPPNFETAERNFNPCDRAASQFPEGSPVSAAVANGYSEDPSHPKSTPPTYKPCSSGAVGNQPTSLDLNINTANTVIVYYGQNSSHPSPQVSQQGPLKLNPGYNPS